MGLTFEKNEKTHLVENILLKVTLPPDFPDKYKSAIARVAGLCTVKRSLAAAPKIDIVTEEEA